MDKQKVINFIAETEEDRYLFSKLYDRMTTAEIRGIPAVSGFLSPREQVLTQRMLPHMNLRFWGGHPEAERRICCWLPEYLDDTWFSSEDCPVAAVRAEFFERDALTHRDFLGSLMGCGLKRDTVGDIFIGKGTCDFLVMAEILPYVLDNLISAGRTKLHLKQIALDELSVPQKTVKQIRDTVTSPRLDSIVGSGFSMSRGRAVELIASGKVSVNDLPCMKPDKLLSEGDKISARGFGKVMLRQLGGRTKKDRITVLLERYL